MIEYFETGIERQRRGNQSGRNQPFGTYQAKDGWVVIAAIGAVFGRMCRVLELDPTDEHWRQARTELESIAGIEFDAILRGWLENRTVKEVVEILNDAQVGCSAVMTPKDIAEDPHYQARSLAGKPLAGFRATPDRRIIVLCGMIVSVIRFKNPLLHRQSSLRKRRLGENRGFRPSF